MAKTILVIDDHPDTMQLISLSLRRHGYQVVGARSGRMGLQEAETHRPDLVLLDIMMPDLDGYQVCRALKQNPNLQHIPVIMFSAKTQANDKLLGFDAGADDYLTKPTRPAELVLRVQAMLDRSGPPAMLEEELLQSPPGRVLTGVLGTRGGAGATTVAINLAASMADSEEQTVLIDLDWSQGHVASYLNEPVSQDVMDFLKSPRTEWASLLRTTLQQRTPYWKLLLTRPHWEGMPAVDSKRLSMLVNHLQQDHQNIIVDMGPPSGLLTDTVVELATHLIICTRSERTAIIATKSLYNHLLEKSGREGLVHVLLVDYRTGPSLPRSAVENFLGFPILDVLSINPALLNHATDKGVPLVNAGPHNELSNQFRQLARQLRTVDNMG